MNELILRPRLSLSQLYPPYLSLSCSHFLDITSSASLSHIPLYPSLSVCFPQPLPPFFAFFFLHSFTHSSLSDALRLSLWAPPSPPPFFPPLSLFHSLVSIPRSPSLFLGAPPPPPPFVSLVLTAFLSPLFPFFLSPLHFNISFSLLSNPLPLLLLSVLPYPPILMLLQVCLSVCQSVCLCLCLSVSQLAIRLFSISYIKCNLIQHVRFQYEYVFIPPALWLQKDFKVFEFGFTLLFL